MPVQTEEEASGQEQIFVEQGEAPGWGQPDGHQVRNEIMVAALVSMLFCMYQPLYRNIFSLRGKEEEKIFVETGQALDCGEGEGTHIQWSQQFGARAGDPSGPRYYNNVPVCLHLSDFSSLQDGDWGPGL